MLKLSQMIALGTPLPEFALPDRDGSIVRASDLAGAPLLVAFICNHCPFVLHVIDAFVPLAKSAIARGVGVVAISSNDPAEFPEDGPEQMAAFAREHGFTFPYLYDESQDVALSFGAICTPDFFLYGADSRLFYCGQFDASRPRTNRPPVPGLPPLRTDLPVTGGDLSAAIDAVVSGGPPPEPQRPSAGCSIKWRPGKEPVWG